MARDPNARVGQPIEIITAADAKKNSVTPPAGYVLGTSAGQYYAFLITHADGHTTVQWLKRGAGGGPGQPDPVELETAGPPSPADADVWAKGEAADAKPDQVVNINGVPSQVIGKDANGRDIWGPAQTPSGPATATTAGTKEWRTEGTPDGQGGFNNAQPIMAAYVNGQRTGETRAPTAKDLEDWNLAGQMTRNPGGKTDADIAAEQKAATDAKAKADATATAQQPKRDVQPDPKHPGYVVVTTTTPATATTAATQTTHYEKEGASGVTVPAPAEEAKDTPKAVTRGGKTFIEHTTQGVNGKPGEIYWTDDQGNRVSLPPETSFVGEPAGAPPMGGYGSVTESRIKYRDFLAEKVKNQELTPEQADKLMAARLSATQALADEQQGVVSTQTGMAGQQITQRGQSLGETQSRRTAATGVYSTVLNQFMPLLRYMPKGGGQGFVDLLNAGLGVGLQQANLWGGMKDVPEIQYGPAAQAANRAGMPGGVGMPGAQGGGPGLVPPAPPSFMTPYQPPAAGVPPGAPPAPTGPPAASVAPTGRVMTPSSATTTNWPTAPPPPINPPAGQPGNNPNAPVGMAGPSFMQPYAQPQMPPLPGLQMMIDDPSIDNGIVAQAYREVFGQDMPGFGGFG